MHELREKLAAIEHERWADWQRYFHSKCDRDPDGSLAVPPGYVAALERLIETPYADLAEDQKDNDRREVDRYWPLIEELERQKTREHLERLSWCAKYYSAHERGLALERALAAMLDLAERQSRGFPPPAEEYFAIRDAARATLERPAPMLCPNCGSGSTVAATASPDWLCLECGLHWPRD